MIDDLETIDPWTVCDRCGDETPVVDTSTGLKTWPAWAGATLCRDCWAEAEDEAEAQRVPWQRFEVIGGRLARNGRGQFAGVMELANGLAVTFVFDRSGAKWGWQPAEPEFAPDFTEE